MKSTLVVDLSGKGNIPLPQIRNFVVEKYYHEVSSILLEKIKGDEVFDAFARRGDIIIVPPGLSILAIDLIAKFKREYGYLPSITHYLNRDGTWELANFHISLQEVAQSSRTLNQKGGILSRHIKKLKFKRYSADWVKYPVVDLSRTGRILPPQINVGVKDDIVDTGKRLSTFIPHPPIVVIPPGFSPLSAVVAAAYFGREGTFPLFQWYIRSKKSGEYYLRYEEPFSVFRS